MRINIHLPLVVLASLLLSACSTTTNISSLQNGALVHIKNDTTSMKVKSGKLDEKSAAAAPRTESFPVSTFGKYEFKAELPGQEPFYGMLPRKFNGGYLALDILFFTPAMLVNLKEVYPFYEFDVEKRILRFKTTRSEIWKTYQPSLEEINRARDHFGEPPVLAKDYYRKDMANASEISPDESERNGKRSRPDATEVKLEMLNESLSRGDITKDEYEKRRIAISNGVI